MTQPTTERDRIKERVAKLLNLTLDKGASENEAMMAAEKAAELMAFYDVEASEISVRSARAIKQTVSARKYGKMIIGAPVAHHLAQLCDCMYWGSTEETGKRYTFFGVPADAEIAAYLFDLISNGIATEVGIYKTSSDYLTATGTHGRTLVSSFIAGMEDRICAGSTLCGKRNIRTFRRQPGARSLLSKRRRSRRTSRPPGSGLSRRGSGAQPAVADMPTVKSWATGFLFPSASALGAQPAGCHDP